MNRRWSVGCGLLFCAILASSCNLVLVSTTKADTFGSGASSFEIEFVKIDQPGNPSDANPNPAGAVPYEYRIGKYEVSEQMIDKANAEGGLGITKDTRGADLPATSISWFEAARFVNWLNESTGHTPAYKFDDLGNFQLWQPVDSGYDPNNLYRNRKAFYFLPSIDEWHKAAYYDPVAGVYYDYPTGSDSVPDGINFVGDPNFDAVFFDGASNPEPNTINEVGLLSATGTSGQGGNVFEWDETAFDRVNDIANDHRAILGGSWVTASNVLLAAHTGGGTAPSFEDDSLGFRVASVPEPPPLLLLIVALPTLWLSRRTASWGHS